jgi:hypothetical protein
VRKFFFAAFLLADFKYLLFFAHGFKTEIVRDEITCNFGKLPVRDEAIPITVTNSQESMDLEGG